MQGTDPSHPRADEDPSARRPFGQAFWMCNVIEMWERLAYFSVRVVAHRSRGGRRPAGRRRPIPPSLRAPNGPLRFAVWIASARRTR
jgi:hypothetical protein